VSPVHSLLFLFEVGFVIPCMKDMAERKTRRSLQKTKTLQVLVRKDFLKGRDCMS
jgi:hypothetical protein